MLSLCVDVGTSLIKCVAYDDAGREVAVAREPTTISRPAPGHAEQDMDDVWNGVARAIRAARRHVDAEIGLIAFTAQGDGCWLVDDAGRPVGPAALWSDGRSSAIVERWRRDGTIERAFRINGSMTFSGLPNALLHWLREHEPERLARAHKALYCGGWIFLRLTGELAVDESDASAPLLDIRTRAYSPELLELFDLEWAAPLLPEVRADDHRVGSLSEAAATELGLPAGLPVFMAPYDIAATAIGVGATGPGQACSILGTTLCTEVVTSEIDTGGTPSGFTIAMGAANRHLRAYPSLAGTEVIGWAMRLLGLDRPEALGALAARVDAGPGDPVFLPYLSPAGERAPFLDPEARGTFVGLSLEHQPEHLALAVMEGLSHVIRDCLEASRAPADELRLCGGGARSDYWCQSIADTTGIRTLRSADSELGAKGALIAGLVATGELADVDSATHGLIELRDSFEPREDRHAFHTERFEQFRELRRICAPAWRALAVNREAPAAVGTHG